MNALSTQFNSFYPSNQSCWTKIKNKLLHRDPWQGVLKSKSKVEIIDLLTEELKKQLDSSVLSLKSHTFEKIDRWNLPFLLGKLDLTEAQIAEDCKNEALLVENSKKNFIKVTVQSIFRRIFPETVNFFHRLIDTVLMSFGYYQIGRDTNGQWEASEILKLYLQILLYPSTVFLVLNNTFNNPVLAAAVTAAIVLVTIIAVIVYVRCIKPCPDKLYGFDNLSTKAKKNFAGQDPKSSIEVLKEAVAQLDRDPENKLKNETIKLEQEMQTIKSSFIRGDSTKAAQIKTMSDKLKMHTSSLAEKKKLLEEQKQQLLQLKKLRKLRIKTKEEIYEIAVKIKSLDSKNKSSTDLKCKWATGTYLILPALEKLIKIKSEELSKKYPEIRTKIDIALIDKIIAEKNHALAPVVPPATGTVPGTPAPAP